MKITIKNYKNIKSIDYKIDDGKINFLFGLSGCGKSSVLNALCADAPDDDKTFGTNGADPQIIEIDGRHVSPTKMHIFNVEKVNFILQENTIEPISEIIIEDPKEHEKNHKALENRLEKLNLALKSELQKFNDIDQFLSSLKIKKLNKGDLLPSSCIFSKAISNIKSFSSKKLFALISSYDAEYVEWLNTGFDYINSEKCPFCENKLSSQRRRKLTKIKELDSENIISLKNELKIHSFLLDKTLSFQYSQMKLLEKRIISFAKAANVYKKISEQVYLMFEPNYNATKFFPIKYDSCFSKHFPESSKEYKKLCNNIPKLVNAINKTHVETDSFLKNKKQTINSLLDKAGIPYKFDVSYHRSGPNEYFIVHNNNFKNTDNRNCLSEGERSIVSLILFLVSSAKTNYELYMIDDPVSSFDNLRRMYIYRLIKEYLKNKTVLVLSHDAVFAKFALDDSSLKCIGSISYLSNNGINAANIISIKNERLINFNKCLVEQLKLAKNEYQKAILARLLIEEEYNKSEKYTYLSKIVHGNAYKDIIDWIARKSKTEMDYINQINAILIKYGLKSNYLVPLSTTYNNIDITNYTDYEKCILLKKLIEKNIVSNVPPSIIEELNNYTHLTDTLDIMINPFKFPMISRSLSDYLSKMNSSYCL